MEWAKTKNLEFCHDRIAVEALKIIRDLGAGTAGVPACPRRT